MENIEVSKKKSPAKQIKVTFKNGPVISEKKPTDTYLMALITIGLARIAKLEDIVVDGYPLVVKKKDHRKQIRNIDETWYVSTHMCTAAKKRIIERVADKLKIKLEVEFIE